MVSLWRLVMSDVGTATEVTVVDRRSAIADAMVTFIMELQRPRETD